MNLFDKHRERFERAMQACDTRECWSPFPEMPNKVPDAVNAQARGKRAFEAHLNRPFVLDQAGLHADTARLGNEVSPYTGAPLGITYAQAGLDVLFAAAEAAIGQGWGAAEPETRVGVLLEVIERLYQRIFEVSFAVMHTAGQSFNMSYAGSGVNALDRGIEALVYAHRAMAGVTRRATWTRQFGAAGITLDKTYRLMPRGVAACFTCASFPTWNAWPSMMASLATGNAFVARAEDAYAQAGAQLTINLTGPMPLNFAAAYSDYHVTGLNPAGNAALTDTAFVASRFRITQSRRPALQSPSGDPA